VTSLYTALSAAPASSSVLAEVVVVLSTGLGGGLSAVAAP
jgi:hypothetical protein